MIEIFIVVLLLYVSFKLKQQEKLIRLQNDFIDSLQENQKHCTHHIKNLEKHYDLISKDKELQNSKKKS